MGNAEASTDLATTEETEPEGALAAHNEPGGGFVARVGAFFLVTEESDAEKLTAELLQALRADNRVESADVPTRPGATQDFPHMFQLTPAALTNDADEVVLITSQRAIELLQPFVFTVSVPTKNQPNNTPFDEVASDKYAVVWDGTVVAIAWRAPAPEHIPPAGGQVVADILRAAAEKVGASLYVQACSPNCGHEFNHTDLVLAYDPSISLSIGGAYCTQIRWAKVKASFPHDPSDAHEAALSVFYEWRTPIMRFGRLKNVGRRILDLEQATRNELHRLTLLQYTRALVLEHRLRDRPAMYRQLRGRRSAARASLARLWLAVTQIEERRRDWIELYVNYQEDVAENGVELLFAVDSHDEATLIQALDTGSIVRTLEAASARLDQRALVMATAGTGVAAIVGVLVGHFL